ncbi:hypothetical protein WA026_010940 [Henosepilachna vigintioctopunctata]|uniref:Uncharacterized protein n=1 Tax=Henosepilachna vigintioctopunctata TaxID=420089 RepID=A0AAW1UX25_9CUCU
MLLANEEKIQDSADHVKYMVVCVRKAWEQGRDLERFAASVQYVPVVDEWRANSSILRRPRARETWTTYCRKISNTLHGRISHMQLLYGGLIGVVEGRGNGTDGQIDKASALCIFKRTGLRVQSIPYSSPCVRVESWPTWGSLENQVRI